MEIDEDSIKVKAFCDLTKPRADEFFLFLLCPNFAQTWNTISKMAPLTLPEGTVHILYQFSLNFRSN